MWELGYFLLPCVLKKVFHFHSNDVNFTYTGSSSLSRCSLWCSYTQWKECTVKGLNAYLYDSNQGGFWDRGFLTATIVRWWRDGFDIHFVMDMIVNVLACTLVFVPERYKKGRFE